MSEALQRELALDAKRKARKQTTARHARDIARLIPIALELALRAGQSGIVVGDVRLVAERSGLIEALPTDRRLSWLWAVLPAAGLVKTGRQRTCPQPRTRNGQSIYVHPRYA
jgi:hypothetical protein